MKKFLLLSLMLPSLGNAVELRSMSFDGPYTVNKGILQAEFGFSRSREDETTTDSSGARVRTKTIDGNIGATNLRYGITNSFEAQAYYDAYKYQRQQVDALTTIKDGRGDLTLRLKWNVFGNDGGSAFALQPFWKVSTNTNRMGHKSSEGGLFMSYYNPLPLENLGLEFTLQVDRVENTSTLRHYTRWIQGAIFTYTWKESLYTTAEMANENSQVPGSAVLTNMAYGLGYSFSKNLLWEAKASFAVTPAAADSVYSMRIGFRF